MPDERFKARRAAPSDAEAVLGLIEEYYQAADVRHRDDPGKLRSYLADAQGGIWITEYDGVAVGCIALRRLPDMDAAGEIKRMYVRPEYRGKGIAANLLSELERWALQHGFKWLYLDSKEEMRQAAALYTRSGFKPCERYNDNSQAAVFMRKELPCELELRDFQAGDEAAFRQLNEAWIRKYFKLEQKDNETLQHPREHILSKGGRIFLATRASVAVGCCALIPMCDGSFELSKMGVAETEQGRGIGRRMLQHVVDQARVSGVARLYLETNRTLQNAIHLYEAIGFKHVPQERVKPSPYQRANVFMEMLL